MRRTKRFEETFVQPVRPVTRVVYAAPAKPKDRDSRNAQCPHCLGGNTQRRGNGGIHCNDCRIEVSSTLVARWAETPQSRKFIPIPIPEHMRKLCSEPSGATDSPNSAQ